MMKNPGHPGAILRELVVAELNLTVKEIARRLSVSRAALSRVLNEKAGISADLAIRLEKAGISSAAFWMNLQSNWELAQALKRERPPIEPLTAV
ncbi:HigA family addiction module antitoxin [Propylenella binzhouense]|uniref:Addiction module antidote protein, HigA family n=1 Tax=Propylenella binzhouense TaxID=2555902 RepID=A0A964WSJ7_9HYPH|nr:HigA family addiction module antitoxin [Propylenella binzhouense]MYZ47044.1 addiction module antidote protein, HigA family [Propylenella binzhouense]